jgi:cation transport regulator ChaB
VEYPTPFLIKRGVFRNAKFIDLLSTKGEFVVGKALEYLLLLKKGSQELTLSNQPEFTYSEADLKKVKDDLQQTIQDRINTPGVSSYVTNFDTEVEHLIPEYQKALAQELFTPAERRVLAGLGMIDVLQGISSTRKETTLNPRPFIAEVESGIEDFKTLLTDVMMTIIEKNKISHPKSVGQINKISSTPISHFITDEVKTQFRSMYDRGVISKKTYAEVCGAGDVDFEVEVQRRKDEAKAGLKKTMYPPVTQNQEQYNDPGDEPVAGPDAKTDSNGKPVPTDKQGPEAKNYKGAVPEDVAAVLPEDGQKIWLRIYNESSENGEEYASKMAWTITKKFYKKDGDVWVRKAKTTDAEGKMINLESASADMIENIIKMQEIELKEKQSKLLSKLLKEKN